MKSQNHFSLSAKVSKANYFVNYCHPKQVLEDQSLVHSLQSNYTSVTLSL